MNRKIGLLIILLLALAVMAVIVGSCLRGLAGDRRRSGRPRRRSLEARASPPARPFCRPCRHSRRGRPAPASHGHAGRRRHSDPKLIIITEADVLNAVAAGIGAQQGLAIDGLDVEFTEGRMRLTADRLNYGPAVVLDLVLVGSLVAQDGRLQLRDRIDLARRTGHIADPLFRQPGAGAICGAMVCRRGAHAGRAAGAADSVRRGAWCVIRHS